MIIYIYIFFFFLRCSEYISKTGATGVIKDEATNINSSLSFLGIVITTLVDGKYTHISYWNSKLTPSSGFLRRKLKDSFSVSVNVNKTNSDKM